MHDVVTAAGQADGAPLLRISLRQLLGSQPDWGKSKTETAMARMLTLLGEAGARRDQTIAWLVDPRVRGTRLIAFADATAGRTGPPWPGFPFAPSPFA